MTNSQIRSDSGLAVTLRMAFSRLARWICAERAARGLRELSGTPLAALVRHAAMTPGRSAGHETVQPPSTIRIIAVQEERGLKARAPHPTDKRRVALRATAAGRDLAGQERMLKEARLISRLGE